MNAIFAVNALGGFGFRGGLPWPKCSTDLARFKRLTTGATVVMGSGTWGSDMPKPLPGRRNIVLSTTLVDSRCEVVGNITALLMALRQDEGVWVIGGAKVLWKLRPYITTVYLTKFPDMSTADVVLDVTKYLEGYALQERQTETDHQFEIWTRT